MSSSASPHPPKPVSPQKETDSDSARGSRRVSIPSTDNQPTVISNRPPIPTSHGNDDDTTRHLKTIRPGTRLGDIELTEHIGGGGMGQVYRGEDKRLGRSVAVKVLSRDQSSDQEAVRRFLNEAKSAARLNHQNIAQVYSAGESEEHPYIVFEYIQGVNLRAMLEEQGPLMLEEALSYTLQIADALAHAADRRIVHRDVKPSNVLIAPNGQAKLIDLGLARLSEPGNADGDLTASGVTLGTFDYISPEQARDPRNADSRSDIYSLGCTLFYMLAGRPPFPEGTVLQKLLQHQGDTPPDVCQFRPDLPEEVSHVLGKMMAKDPRRRYPDSARLMEALLTLADMIGLRPTGPAQAIWLPPQESRISVLHRQTPWLAPTLTLTCLILGLHLLWSSQEEPGNTRSFSRPERQAVATKIPPESEPSSHQPTDQLPGDEAPGSNSEEPSGQPQENGEPSERTSHRLMRTSTTPFTPLSRASHASSAAKPGSALPPPPLTASYSPNPRSEGIFPPSLLGSVSGDLPAPTALPAAAQATPAPASTIPLIVTHSPQDNSQYRSIGAAIAANPEANLIELRYDGRGVEEPFTITGHRLTIRGGANHAPILMFEPSATDPVLYPRDMIHVGDGGLVLEGLTVELNIPRDMPSDSWSLLRLSAGGHGAFRDCTLRVQNASDSYGTYHQDVAFFRATPQEPRPASSLNSPRTEREPDIELLNCNAFGEACLVRTAENTAFRMKWTRGHLATTEPALSIGGSSRGPAPDTKTEIAWENVVAVTEGALISITLTPRRPHLAPLNFTDTSCVFSSVPLVQANVISEDELLSQFTWISASSRRPDSSTPLSIINRSGVAPEDDLATKNWLKAYNLPEISPRLIRQSGTLDSPMHSMTPSHIKNLSEAGASIETAPSPNLSPDQAPGQPTTEPPTTD
jgi:serine/threonine protein kinase